jgi:transposase-like protein
MTKTRRHFTAEQKAEVVRRHLAKQEPVSKLAEELGVQPSQVHLWVNQVLSQAARVFDNPKGRPRDQARQEQTISRLEAKLAQKNEVIAELLEANVREKKANGVL